MLVLVLLLKHAAASEEEKVPSAKSTVDAEVMESVTQLVDVIVIVVSPTMEHLKNANILVSAKRAKTAMGQIFLAVLMDA